MRIEGTNEVDCALDPVRPAVKSRFSLVGKSIWSGVPINWPSSLANRFIEEMRIMMQGKITNIETAEHGPMKIGL